MKNIGRREFVYGMTAASAVTVLSRHDAVAAAPSLETPRLRLADVSRGICVAPQYVAVELLRDEGFTDVKQVQTRTFSERLRLIATGDADMLVTFVSTLITRIDAGDPIVMLAGAHIGCFELFGAEKVRTVGDLKDKTIAVTELGSPEHLFLSVILLQVGLDPRRDVRWVTHPQVHGIRLLAEGKVDAFLGFPPAPQELRAKKIGHVILDSTTDRPWSQYFCCMVAANRDFVRRHPVAAKQALRAFIKAAERCALEPERVARFLVDNRHTDSYEYALQALKYLPYGKWREYKPEEAVRFYALRLHEAGLVKASPQKLIAQGTDWRFVNELKKELKG